LQGYYLTDYYYNKVECDRCFHPLPQEKMHYQQVREGHLGFGVWFVHWINTSLQTNRLFYFSKRKHYPNTKDPNRNFSDIEFTRTG
jgi:hypothetical protein